MAAPVLFKDLALSKSGLLAIDISKMEMRCFTSAGDVVTLSSLWGVVMFRGGNARGMSFKVDCVAKYRWSKCAFVLTISFPFVTNVPVDGFTLSTKTDLNKIPVIFRMYIVTR